MYVMNDKDVEHYAGTRYSKPDQWLVNYREQAIVRDFINKYHLKDLTILDIPCGFGRFTPLFLKNHMKVISSDISQAMVKRTREKSQDYKGEKYYLVASVKELPFREGSIHVTFTARLLHHNLTAEDRIRILKELRRVTKRYAIVTMYRENLFHKLTRRIRGLKRIIVMLSDEEITREITHSGFRIIEKRIMLPIFHAQVFLLLEKV